MPQPASVIKGKVHGRNVELDSDPGLRDGADVTVRIQTTGGNGAHKFGDGIRQSAGSWAEEAEQVDQFIEDVYRARHDTRPEPGRMSS